MGKKFILQGVTLDSHLHEIRQVIDQSGLQRLIISVAFLSQRGFDLIHDVLKPSADRTTVLAGVRNGITSAQGLLASMECGCKTYAVDTGSRNVLFHPKFYLASAPHEAKVVLGSANLTVGGLGGNIEASVILHLDRNLQDDKKFIADLEGKVDLMISDYPAHVLEIGSEEDVYNLLKSGRVIDEKVKRSPAPGGISEKRELDEVPKIDLKSPVLELGPVTDITERQDLHRPLRFAMEHIAAPDDEQPVPGNRPLAAPELVWVSKPLSRRALNIPFGEKTAPTGSMLFTKGKFVKIDQRHYFRERVFHALTWTSDTNPSKEHLERAEANFTIVIKNVDYGVFSMKLTHDSRTDSQAYEQNNSVTQLHWGDVKSLVAQEDLLGRELSLFRDESQPDLFVLEID